METGDRLFLYTDGIIEARSPEGSFYDSNRLTGFFAEHGGEDPARFAGSLLEDVQTFCNGASQSDDQAVLIVGFDGIIESTANQEARESLAGASVMVSNGLTSDAAIVLEELRKRRPEDPRIMNALALVRLKLGDTAGAERLLRTATCMAPEITEYADNLAAILASKDS
jgi:hypothetical protein